MAKSNIAWTYDTWNPLTGCSPVSAGCEHCYAAAIAHRFNGGDFTPKFHPERLGIPAKWKKGRNVFVGSTTDIGHPDHEIKDVLKVFDAMAANPQHIYQILTKRPLSLDVLLGMWRNPIPENWWIGVSVEDNESLYRFERLRKIPCAHRFVSFEPLLEAIGSTDLTGIDWVIAGGETGAGARVCDAKWIDHIAARCLWKNIPFFFKQWGSNSIRIPSTLNVASIEETRQFPAAMMQHLGR